MILAPKIPERQIGRSVILINFMKILKIKDLNSNAMNMNAYFQLRLMQQEVNIEEVLKDRTLKVSPNILYINLIQTTPEINM